MTNTSAASAATKSKASPGSGEAAEYDNNFRLQTNDTAGGSPVQVSLLQQAKDLVAAGCSVIPVNLDGTKKPAELWKEFQERRPSNKELKNWFSSGKHGLGVICGAISGNLEAIDIDDPEIKKDFCRLVADNGLADFIQKSAVVQATPKDGLHIVYRCEAAVAGNQKLANKDVPGKPVRVETRGEGGFIVHNASDASVHPLNKPYALISGSFANIPVLTVEQRETLLDVARSFNQVFEPVHVPQDIVKGEGRPGDDYASKISWREILEPHGWRVMFSVGEVDHWRRPGKVDGSTSATTNYQNSDKLIVFSTNAWPFDGGKSYDKFSAFAFLNHKGEFSEAAKELSRLGFGEPLTRTNTETGIPKNFKCNADGVFALVEKDNESDWKKVCSPLHITACTSDANHTSQGRLLEFTDIDGRVHTWAMPMAMTAGDGAEYRTELLSQGLTIEPGRKSREHLQGYIQSCTPSRRVTCVSTTGWHELAGEKVFVLPDQTIHFTMSAEILFQSSEKAEPLVTIKGTAEQWAQRIGILCSGNSRLVLGVSDAFTAPLLGLIDGESGLIHFRGGSSIGKTTTLEVAASVFGIKKISWKGTANGIEAQCVRHNDLPIALDEIGQADPHVVAETIYMIANGVSKSRMSKGMTGRKNARWNTRGISTGEIGLAAILAKIGLTPKAGEMVRLIEVPADAGKGRGIFETLHNYISGAVLSEHLKSEASNVYGGSGKKYLEHVVANAKTLPAAIKVARAKWMKDNLPENCSGQVQRVGGHFALCAFAGELATEIGLTGWTKGEAERAAKKCFDEWLANRGTNADLEDGEIISKLREFIQLHEESRFSPDNEMVRTFNRAGFRKNNLVLLFKDCFRKEIYKSEDWKRAELVLKERKILIDKKGDMTPNTRLPDQSSQRVYVIDTHALTSNDDSIDLAA